MLKSTGNLRKNLVSCNCYGQNISPNAQTRGNQVFQFHLHVVYLCFLIICTNTTTQETINALCRELHAKYDHVKQFISPISDNLKVNCIFLLCSLVSVIIYDVIVFVFVGIRKQINTFCF